MAEDSPYSSACSSMAEDSPYSTGTTDNNKRKHEDYHDRSPPSYLSRRPSGFSPPIIDSTQQNPNNSYNPSSNDEIQQAKQKAQEIAARIFNSAEAHMKNRDGYKDAPDIQIQNQLARQRAQQIADRTFCYVEAEQSPYIEGDGCNVAPNIQIQNQLARQRAEQIAVRLFGSAAVKAKHHRSENGYSWNDEFDGTDYGQKQPQMPISYGGGTNMAYSQGGSKRIEIPKEKLRIIIGRHGDTIKNIQLMSGAKIQLFRATEDALTLSVELMGTPDEINRAEQLINEALAKATMFKSDSASTLFGCDDFEPVYNFLVPRQQKEFYQWVVETHGHIPTTTIISEMNTLITATRVLLDAAAEMHSLGDTCPSEEKLKSWRKAFELSRALQFNISWLEKLLEEIEKKCNSRREVLPVEIAKLEGEVESIKQEQLHLAKEAADIAARIAIANSDLADKEKALAEKKHELVVLAE